VPLWLRSSHSLAPWLFIGQNVVPLQKSERALTPAEVEQILAADFRLIRRVQQIPAAGKADYTALANEPFEIVNPGHPRSTDAIIAGVPNKELVCVGLAYDNAVLIFKRGGLFDTTNAAVFSHRGSGSMWTARIDNSVQDIAALRNAVHNHRFEPRDADFLFAHPPKCPATLAWGNLLPGSRSAAIRSQQVVRRINRWDRSPY
jgi:hypothetical protein